jgi:signal transduction histidine kinase
MTQYRDHLEELVKQRTQELQATLDQLAVAKDRAESADRLKSAFLATMSHELRTPLNSIIGFTGVLLQNLAGQLNEEQAKQLTMVRSSANHLLVLINDVLDISKIEAGQMNIVFSAFDVREVVEHAVALTKPLADKKHIGFSVNISPDVGKIKSDRQRFEQILLNLLSNAVKFADAGDIRIESNAQGDTITTSVTDRGIGIAPEEGERLFKAFYQAENGITRRYEGTGLGLYICRKLLTLMGGRIWLASEPGKGSTFSFSLPREMKINETNTPQIKQFLK